MCYNSEHRKHLSLRGGERKGYIFSEKKPSVAETPYKPFCTLCIKWQLRLTPKYIAISKMQNTLISITSDKMCKSTVFIFW